MIVTTILEVVLGDRLIVTSQAVGHEDRENPRGHDDAEVVVQTGDGVLGGVNDHDVLVLGAVGEVREEGLNALVELAALVLALEQEHGDVLLHELKRAMEEVGRGDVAGALPLHLLENAHGEENGLAPERARTNEHGVRSKCVLLGKLLSLGLKLLTDVEEVLPDVLVCSMNRSYFGKQPRR